MTLPWLQSAPHLFSPHPLQGHYILPAQPLQCSPDRLNPD